MPLSKYSARPPRKPAKAGGGRTAHDKQVRPPPNLTQCTLSDVAGRAAETRSRKIRDLPAGADQARLNESRVQRRIGRRLFSPRAHRYFHQIPINMVTPPNPVRISERTHNSSGPCGQSSSSISAFSFSVLTAISCLIRVPCHLNWTRANARDRPPSKKNVKTSAVKRGSSLSAPAARQAI